MRGCRGHSRRRGHGSRGESTQAMSREIEPVGAALAVRPPAGTPYTPRLYFNTFI